MGSFFSAENKAIATIQNCAEEPIHIPGSIQPHGFVLVIDDHEAIALCSQNVESFLKRPNRDLLSKPFHSVLPENLSAAIRDYITGGKKSSLVPQPVLLHEPFDCFFREAGPYFIVECVLTSETVTNVYDALQQTNDLVNLITQQTDLQALCQLITRKVHQITGFDRVMVYRFDDMYNGKVFAETVAAGYESFLGLHYPHTDIPPQARALYIKNLIRLIADVDYTPVPIITLDPNLAQPQMVDMSNMQLRSVSPIHLQYLKNMGVQSSFSISLIKNGQLWGLVACHHHAPKQLPFSRQMQAFLQTQILSSQLAVQETAEKYNLSVTLEAPLKMLLQTLAREVNFTELYFENMSQVLEIVNATGAVLLGRKKIYCNGIVPSREQIDQLHTWLLEKEVEQFHTHKLSSLYQEASEYQEIASGVLFYRVVLSNSKSSIIFFRNSQTKVIKWAGEPKTNQGLEALTPRNSFAAWQQNVEGESLAWMEAEIQAGFHFTYALQANIFRQYLREEEISIRQLNDQLLKANKEVENINWISSHDLKEPLRKIQMFASLIRDPFEEGNLSQVTDSVNKIHRAASRMQRLIDDLLLYSRMSGDSTTFETISLPDLLVEVMKSFEDEIAEGIIQVETGTLPAVFGNRFQLQQLFINLIGNSIKFRKPGTMQHLKIEAKENADVHIVSVCDEGIGLPPGLNEKIFNIFQRAHTTDIPGTGIGLAMCRKIMENHGGSIKADSKADQGACFDLYFPVRKS